MMHILKIKQYWILTIGIVICSMTTFAQELSDETIGFDIVKETALLKKYGVTDQNIAREITLMRKWSIRRYLAMEKSKEVTLQDNTKVKQNSRITTNRALAITVADIPQTEKDVLKAFYDISRIKSNLSSTYGWNFSMPVTSWDENTKTGWKGVTVSNGRVIGLDLSDHNLYGTIPINIYQLKELQSFAINNSSIYGSIPSEIMSLINLRSLSFLNTNLTGATSGLYNLRNLETLIISNQTSGADNLSSPFPQGIEELSKLTTLNLSGIWGAIPIEIGQLRLLQDLQLYGSQLSGTIPKEIGQLGMLKNLQLYSSQLSGTIPKEIGRLGMLKTLNLTCAQLAGSIPTEIGQLYNLEKLVLERNLLSGPIPSSIGQLSKLNFLSISVTQVSGSIPSDIFQLPNIKTLYIDSNPNLSGTLPVIKLPKAELIFLGYNNLTGSIPVLDCPNLTDIYLNFNKFSSISSNLGNAPMLTAMPMEYNELTGEVPFSLFQFPNLRSLSLSNNKLSSIPPEVYNSSNVTELYLDSNRFRFFELAHLNNDSFVDGGLTAPQSKTDQEETIVGIKDTSTNLTMFTDGKFTPNDTFQWYKGISPNGTLINGATSRVYTISNLNDTNAGNYYCISKNTQFPSLILEREPITLTITDCAPIIGKLKINSTIPLIK
jgi:Leucine-rich repeat (LRR) protein